ncbi:MAG: glycosyltransferase, partial [Phycisphaeraceae bacterium]|nr:glycosyltransferase [Phycisphaeraceae bacterium]
MNESIDTSSGRARSTVAIVVPAWNEAGVIAETVSVLRAGLDEIGRSGEVVVVDDASEDSTADLAAAAGARVVRVEKRHIAAVRNAGAAATESDLLVFVDADTVVPSETLRTLL